MSKEELRQLLRDNLEVFVSVQDEDYVNYTHRIKVSIYFDNELIDSDYDTISIED